MVDETGSGKPVMAGVRSSTEVRFGPDPRISIQARGRQPAALQRPDTRQHLTACPCRPKKTLASTEASTHGGVHTRANGRRDGIGKTSHGRRALKHGSPIWTRSAYFHTGPRQTTRRTPEAGHTTAPDRMPLPSKENACINGGVHTRRRPHKGKWSTRRDRENQSWPACAQARKSDLDPIRVFPYRPAADNPPHSRGRTHDST